MMAGNPGDLRTVDFLGMKLVVAGLLGVGFFVMMGVLLGSPAFGFLGGIAFAGIGFMVPEFWLSRRIKRRQKGILMAVPDTLDLLTISVKAGLSFDGALSKVVEKTMGPLADEFRRALAEIRVGKARRDALRDVIARTDVPALSNFIAAIVQAEQLGVPIAKVLQVQSEQLRIERRQRAEETGRQGADQDALPARRLHLPVDVHRHPWPRDHPDRARTCRPTAIRLVLSQSNSRGRLCDE